ncbi:hypothetical protein L596_015398 [Steinernema carpocapsae]|uniref:Uncharacterized protein n=1 Tax=Steinernema carpocapsae TaxID=34508 RepID=A0A4V6A339_STECR|nr:hypothetical protein L596_015398 [Steinernema carpocapsae]
MRNVAATWPPRAKTPPQTQPLPQPSPHVDGHVRSKNVAAAARVYVTEASLLWITHFSPFIPFSKLTHNSPNHSFSCGLLLLFFNPPIEPF